MGSVRDPQGEGILVELWLLGNLHWRQPNAWIQNGTIFLGLDFRVDVGHLGFFLPVKIGPILSDRELWECNAVILEDFAALAHKRQNSVVSTDKKLTHSIVVEVDEQGPGVGT